MLENEAVCMMRGVLFPFNLCYKGVILVCKNK